MNRALLITTFVAVTLWCGACDDSPTGVSTDTAITRVSGDRQQARVNTYLAEPLAVLVTSLQGHPVPNRRVDFVVILGTGRLNIESAITDERGMASTRLRLGSEPGEEQVQAGVFGSDQQVVFRATALAVDSSAATGSTNEIPSEGPIIGPLNFTFDSDVEGWIRFEGDGLYLSRSGRLYHEGRWWCKYYFPAIIPASATYEYDVNAVTGYWNTSLVVGLQPGFVGHDLSFISTDYLDHAVLVTFNTTPLTSSERLFRVEYIEGNIRHRLYEAPSPFGEHHVFLSLRPGAITVVLDDQTVLNDSYGFLDMRDGYMALISGDGGSGDWFDNITVNPQ